MTRPLKRRTKSLLLTIGMQASTSRRLDHTFALYENNCQRHKNMLCLQMTSIIVLNNRQHQVYGIFYSLPGNLPPTCSLVMITYGMRTLLNIYYQDMFLLSCHSHMYNLKIEDFCEYNLK